MELKKKEFPYISKVEIEDEIYKVSLEELAFRLSIDGLQVALCRKLEDKKIALFTYTFNKSSATLPNGTFIRHYVVIRVLYTIVETRKKFIVYDHRHNILDYSNKVPRKTYAETKVFGIDGLPNALLDQIAEKISEKERNKENQVRF
jgi:hypothetical protein